jgi:hypothetical protein
MVGVYGFELLNNKALYIEEKKMAGVWVVPFLKAQSLKWIFVFLYIYVKSY